MLSHGVLDEERPSTIAGAPDRAADPCVRSAMVAWEYDPVVRQYVTEIRQYNSLVGGVSYASSQSWDYAFGVPLSRTDQAGETMEYSRDLPGRRTRLESPDGGSSPAATTSRGTSHGSRALCCGPGRSRSATGSTSFASPHADSRPKAASHKTSSTAMPETGRAGRPSSTAANRQLRATETGAAR